MHLPYSPDNTIELDCICATIEYQVAP
jgi:hypothetical protein